VTSTTIAAKPESVETAPEGQTGLGMKTDQGKPRFSAGFAVLWFMAFAVGCNGFFVNPNLQTIVITPPTPSLPATQALQLTATGIYDDGSNKNLTGKVTWSTGASNVVTVSSGGLMTAVNAGTTTITASQAIVSGSTSATVTLANVTSITVTPSSQSIQTGDSICFRALAVASGQQQPLDISQTATWNINVVGTTIPETSGITLATCGTGPGEQFTAQTPYAPQQPPNLLLDVTATYPGLNGTVTSNIVRLVITQ